MFFQDLCLVNMRLSSRRHFLSTAVARAPTVAHGKHRQPAIIKKEIDKSIAKHTRHSTRPEHLGAWLQKLNVSEATSSDLQVIKDILQHSDSHDILAMAKLSPHNISILYRLLAKFNCLDLLKQVRSTMTNMEVQPTITDLEIWLIAYTKPSTMKQAQKLITDAQNNGIELSWNNALNTCIRNGDLDLAHDTIKVLAEKPHIQIEAFTYKNLIKAFLNEENRKRSSSLGAAIRTFQLMVQSNTEADGETYSAFIEAYIENSLAHWKDEEHETRISTIERLYEGVLAQPNFELSASLCASLIQLYTQNGTLAKAEQIYHDFRKSEIVSSNVMEATEKLIVAMASRRLLLSVNSLFYELLADGHIFHTKTLSALVYCYGRKNDLESAEQLLNISRDQWTEPCLQPYAALIREHVRLANVDAGRRIFDSIIDRLPQASTSVQIYIYNLLLTGYARTGNVEQCEALWRQMKNQQDVVSFNVMLEAYSTTGSWDKFVNVLDQMHQSKIPFDNRTKSILIFTQIRQGNLDKALSLIKEYASEETLQPTSPNLTGAINSLLQLSCLKGHLEECQLLFHYLQKHGQLTAASYQSFMFCLGKAGATSELKKVYEKALKRNMKIEPAIDRIIRRWLE